MKHKQQVFLDGDVEHYAEIGDCFIVARECYDEADLHKFHPVFKSVCEGQEIQATHIWFNHVGTFIRFTHNGDPFDIKPSNLKLKANGN